MSSSYVRARPRAHETSEASVRLFRIVNARFRNETLATACRVPRTVDVTHLRSLLEFAESGSITRVAERLNYAPSSIHAHLRAIEIEVGIELTERAGRGIALTSAGRAFVPHARR